jgi:alpha-L-fucosidase
MNFEKLLESLIPVLGAEAVKALVAELEKVASGANEAWQKSILQLLADAIRTNGPAGITMAMAAIHDLLDKKQPDMSWADLSTASNVVAQLENAEADKQTAVKTYLAIVGQILGTVIMALIQGFLKKG